MLFIRTSSIPTFLDASGINVANVLFDAHSMSRNVHKGTSRAFAKHSLLDTHHNVVADVGTCFMHLPSSFSEVFSINVIRLVVDLCKFAPLYFILLRFGIKIIPISIIRKILSNPGD